MTAACACSCCALPATTRERVAALSEAHGAVAAALAALEGTVHAQEAELVALRALVAEVPEESLVFGQVTITPPGHVQPADLDRQLTRTERRLLMLATRAYPGPFDADLAFVDEFGRHATRGTVRVHVCRARHKLEPYGATLKNCRTYGAGGGLYRLAALTSEPETEMAGSGR